MNPGLDPHKGVEDEDELPYESAPKEVQIGKPKEEPIEIIIPDLRFVSGNLGIHGSPTFNMAGDRHANAMETRFEFMGQYPHMAAITFTHQSGITDQLMEAGFDELVNDEWEIIIRKKPRRP